MTNCTTGWPGVCRCIARVSITRKPGSSQMTREPAFSLTSCSCRLRISRLRSTVLRGRIPNGGRSERSKPIAARKRPSCTLTPTFFFGNDWRSHSSRPISLPRTRSRLFRARRAIAPRNWKVQLGGLDVVGCQESGCGTAVPLRCVRRAAGSSVAGASTSSSTMPTLRNGWSPTGGIAPYGSIGGRLDRCCFSSNICCRPASNTTECANALDFVESRFVIYSRPGRMFFARSVRRKPVSRIWLPAQKAASESRGTLSAACRRICPDTMSAASSTFGIGNNDQIDPTFLSGVLSQRSPPITAGIGPLVPGHPNEKSRYRRQTLVCLFRS